MSLSRRLVAEFLGTTLLLTAVVGSGIMGERLAGGNAAIALLANSVATGAALVALIAAFGPLSGAHFNPSVSLGAALANRLPWPSAAAYVLVQIVGALAGVTLTHLMFGLPTFAASLTIRSGWSLILSEFVATSGLLAVISATSRSRPATAPFAVAAYITGAYWFTASTSFANPAVTIARAATNTFTGIRPMDVGPFIAAQLAATLATSALLRWLLAEAGEP